jgi:acyl-CoA thioesterase I
MRCLDSSRRIWNGVSVPSLTLVRLLTSARLIAPVSLFALVLTASLAASCGREAREPADASAASAATAAPAPAASASAPAASAAVAPAGRPRIVVLGDSLTAGLGVAINDAYPALLQKKIDRAGFNFEVINSGVSGDTSAGGVRRLDWSLDGDVRILILELGANDGLRGLPVADMVKNLSTIIERARARNITVLLCGMEAPPNFGPEYTKAFHLAFPALAKKYELAFVPFLLNGVAGTTDLNQSDGIHPNVEGARKVADTVWIALEPMLARAAPRARVSS